MTFWGWKTGVMHYRCNGQNEHHMFPCFRKVELRPLLIVDEVVRVKEDNKIDDTEENLETRRDMCSRGGPASHVITELYPFISCSHSNTLIL